MKIREGNYNRKRILENDFLKYVDILDDVSEENKEIVVEYVNGVIIRF